MKYSVMVLFFFRRDSHYDAFPIISKSDAKKDMSLSVVFVNYQLHYLNVLPQHLLFKKRYRQL